MAEPNRNPVAEELEVIMLGSFNPAIFHPEWFLRQKLAGEEDVKLSEEKGLIKAVSREVSEFTLCGVRFLCLNERLSLAAANISNATRLQDLLLQIFSILPHTPVTACGINPQAQYSLKEEANYWHKIGHILAPKDLIWNELVDSPGMLSLTINAPRKGDFPGQTNIKVEPSIKFNPGLFITSNYHYPLPESRDTEKVECLLRFLKSEWKSALGLPRLVAGKIFDKIKPDK